MLDLLFVVMCIIALVGCSSDTQVESDTAIQWEPQYTDEWIVNEYTQNISKPEKFEMDYYVDETVNGRFSIALNEMTMEDTNAYIEQLQSDGFSVIEKDEDDEAGGALLQKDEVYLSIAYTDSGLLLGIILE